VKRHPSLQPLSDDHHGALVLARGMRRVREADAAAAWREARRRYARDLAPHFRVEEELLLPALEAAGERELAARVRDEHARLRALLAAEPGAAGAAAFGALLHEHVRFEERVLFPRAEAVLPAALLASVGRAALAARPQAPG
jgi:hemerythrin-like domain-containing protein